MASGIPWPSRQFFSLSRGQVVHQGVGALGVARLVTDSIGNFSLVLTNLVVGSNVQIFTQSGVSISSRVATSSTEVFVVPAYSAGNPLNNLRIKVRKSTTQPKYQAFETQTTAVVGSKEVFIAQVLDPIA